MKSKILIIYTGGTIGMAENSETGSLEPLDFSHLNDHIPELSRLDCDIEVHSPFEPIDSSNSHPEFWVKLTNTLYECYEQYDGFVVLHGTDTMAYTASAISMMLTGIQKPVVFTGSQLPIGMIRTDGKENLITAIEVAASQKDGEPIIKEVVVYFESRLMRGNRTTKFSSEHFDAFYSPNYPSLADAGVTIDYHFEQMWNVPSKIMKNVNYCSEITIVKLFPGVDIHWLIPAAQEGKLKGIVLESYGAGNAPSTTKFKNDLKSVIDCGVQVLNITQCFSGTVYPGKYETGEWLDQLGVIQGYDLTTETAVVKLMLALANFQESKEIQTFIQKSICGEIDVF